MPARVRLMDRSCPVRLLQTMSSAGITSTALDSAAVEECVPPNADETLAHPSQSSATGRPDVLGRYDMARLGGY